MIGEQSPVLLSVNEAAAVLGVHRATVYRLIRDRELVTTRVGKRIRLVRSDLDRYINEGRK